MHFKQIQPNLSKITIGEIDLFFSYEILVAIWTTKKLYCSENQWGVTTGKHLNHIEPDKKKRISADEFNELVKALEENNKWITKEC